MTEVNKFQPLSTLPLYNDGIGQVTLYDASHANESEEQRIWAVTTIASLAYGNEEAKNPEALYERMKSIKHESLWEFIRPCFDSNDFGISSSVRQQNNDIGWYEKQIPHMIELHQQNIACFRIKIPIFVARQYFRHRAFSYLEMSRRYTKDMKVPFQWYTDYGSYEANVLVDNHHKAAYELYQQLISMGVHTQKASRVIGQDVYTEFYIMCEVKGLKNFFKLRCDSHAQDEIRELANSMLDLLTLHQTELFYKVKPNES